MKKLCVLKKKVSVSFAGHEETRDDDPPGHGAVVCGVAAQSHTGDTHRPPTKKLKCMNSFKRRLAHSSTVTSRQVKKS